MQLNLLGHAVLIHLVVEDALVGILHFSLVQLLLFELLLGLNTASFLTCFVFFFETLFILLLTQSEVSHVLLVDVRLFVQSSTLLRQVSLLVRVPRILLQLRHRRQIASRLARLQVHGLSVALEGCHATVVRFAAL